MVYLIWLIHPKIYKIGKRPKIQILLSTYFYYVSKDNQLAYFNHDCA